ncbi:MAG: hypothetical protein EGR72_03715, partial [Clostridiales bacterium]|nr:hypothetical protein [Clostridiales bacterium]
DTGAMYRAVTLYGIRHGAIRGGVVDAEALERMLPRIGISFVFNPAREASDIYLDGENVEGPIRSLEVSEAVSRCCAADGAFRLCQPHSSSPPASSHAKPAAGRARYRGTMAKMASHPMSR